MAELQVVGLGLSTIDVLSRLEVMPTWEKGTLLKQIGTDGGGPVGTALVAAARLGARVGYIGVCGNDASAELKLSYLTRDGVDTSRVMRRPHPESQVVLVFVHQSTGERVFGLTTMEEDPLKLEELDREYITSAAYLHLDGYHCTAALQAAHWMHQAGKKVVMDAAKAVGDVWKAIDELVEATDILVCGSGFVQALTGVADFWQAAEAVRRIGPQIVVQTEGEQGSNTATATEQFHTPAFKVDVVDTTGAGDVFHGAYLFGLV
ncbi:MAG: PfkB family carbohydrate kinase, partial [Anaerolineaceae bacterium]